MRGQGHTITAIARDVRMWFEGPDKRITGPELTCAHSGNDQMQFRPR
jgi:hypothetical protein